VGVGSNIKLDGDTGIITASGFVGDASQLTGLASNLEQVVNNGNVASATVEFSNPGTSLIASGNVDVVGNVTALKFIGDGSGLTGVAANLQAITDNGNVTSNTVQFTNTGTSLTASGDVEVSGALRVGSVDVALSSELDSNALRISNLETSNGYIWSNLADNALRISNLETSNGYIWSNLADNASRISNLETSNGHIWSNLADNVIRISNLETSNGHIWSNLADNASRISNLETSNGHIWSNLADNVIRISNLETSNGHIWSNLADNASRISNLETSNGHIWSNLADNVIRISNLETSNGHIWSNLADNVIRISNLESADTNHGSDIGLLQSANTIQANLITDLETTTQYISATTSGTVISSNLEVTGNIFMRGDRFIVESETKLINDAIIGIANNNTTSTTDVGILMQRPTANVALIHHGGTNDFTIGYTLNDLEATDITNDTTNEINVSVLGNLYTQNNLTVGNVVTASAFVGDGTGITGIASNLDQIVNNGNVTSNTVQFINNGTSLTASGNVVIGGNVTSTTALISNVATMGTTKTFVVTTPGSYFEIDDLDRPALELHEHQTYIFDTSGVGGSHLFKLSTTLQGTHGGGIEYTDGVDSSVSGKLILTVQPGAPDLYYYCATSGHSVMGNTSPCKVSPTAELVVSGRVVASGNVEASKFIGDGSQLTGISGATTSGLQVVTTNGAITSDAIQFTNTGTSLAASGAVTAASVSATGVVSGASVSATGAVTAASVSATGGISAAYFTGDGSNVNIGEMTAETIPYVDSNKQLRDSHITRTADKTIITSNLEVTGNIFVSGNSYSITSENTVINDRIIGLANNNTSTALDVGLMLQYPQKNVAMIHHGTTSAAPHNGQLTLGYTQSGFDVDTITKDPSNNLTLNVWGHVVTQNNITVGAQGSYYGDGTTLTGVALETDLSDNVTRISALETATIISNSSGITSGFVRGDIIYASADNVLSNLALGTSGQVLKVNSGGTDIEWGTDATGSGSGSGSIVWQSPNNPDIHYSAGNVGINTTTAAFDLDVHGTANVGALTATSLSVDGQTLALATDLSANALRIEALYTGSKGAIIYADATDSLAKLPIGLDGQVLTISGTGTGRSLVWATPSGGSGGSGGSSQWSNVTLDEVYFDGNVGIANTDPGHDLSVGSNLFVDDDGSDVLVVTGNAAMSSLTLGQVSIVASYGLNDILSTSNTSSNIMQLTDATTGLVATGNVHALKFIGDGSGLTGIASNLDQIVNNGNVTSNTVQFSNATTGFVTTANVEVGGELTVSGNATVSSNLTVSENLTVSGNVSDLNVVSNVNMLQTANTAAIKLNSNIVTEFSRSKKLIKYPRVAMTANSSGGYVASAHSEYPHDTNYHAFRVFNNRGVNVPYVLGVGWESANTDTFGDDGLWGGSNASGAPTSSSANTTMTLENGNTIYGEWLQIQLPTKIRLEYVNFLILSGSAHAMAHRAPRAGYVLGSNNGTNWTTLKNWSGIVYDTWTAYYDKFYKFDIDKEVDNYQYFRFVWTETASGSGNSLSRYASCQELEFWGVPEYDPEAHGTDVTVKSKTNVPNTDWLEVYYDAKGLANGSTTVNDLKPVGTANNGTVGGNTSVTDEAFTFDGTGDYITSTVTTGTGNRSFSVACWFNFTTLGGLLWGFTGTTDGTDNSPSNNSTPHAYFNTTGSINFDFWASATVTAENLIEPNRWYAGVWTYDGNARKIYIDGTQVNVPQSSTPLSIIDNTSRLSIGIYPTNLSGGPMTGSVANFRLFNRALTSDEIYQLYAYQKEYFGHGDLSMTLKAGRLGIGTSEPRAALDVRGDIMGGCPVVFDCVASSTTAVGSYINWNLVKLNKGSGLNGTTFTAPVEGHYFFHVHVMGVWTGSSSDVRFIMEWHKNGLHYGVNSELDAQMYDGRDDVDGDYAHLKLSGSIIPYLEIGDTIKIIVDSHSTMGVHGRYNRFTGHYIG
jgi:hypothetical protein